MELLKKLFGRGSIDPYGEINNKHMGLETEEVSEEPELNHNPHPYYGNQYKSSFTAEEKAIIEELVADMGLEKIRIQYRKCNENRTNFNKNEKGLDIIVDIENGLGLFDERRFRGNMAHELWHVKTSLELISHIGEDAFLYLRKIKEEDDKDYPATLGFRTISEYMSRIKELRDYNNYPPALKENIIGNYIKINSYEKPLIKFTIIDVCYVIASAFAAKQYTSDPTDYIDDYKNMLDNHKTVVDGIEKILQTETEWPLEVSRYKEIGERMYELFKTHVPVPVPTKM